MNAQVLLTCHTLSSHKYGCSVQPQFDLATVTKSDIVAKHIGIHYNRSMVSGILIYIIHCQHEPWLGFYPLDHFLYVHIMYSIVHLLNCFAGGEVCPCSSTGCGWHCSLGHWWFVSGLFIKQIPQYISILSKFAN